MKAENGQVDTTADTAPVLLASEDIEMIVLQIKRGDLATGHPKEEKNPEGTDRRGNHARLSPEDIAVIEIDMIAAVEKYEISLRSRRYKSFSPGCSAC